MNRLPKRRCAMLQPAIRTLLQGQLTNLESFVSLFKTAE